LGVRGPKSKIEEQRFLECNVEKLTAKNGLIPSRNKKRSDLKERDRQTDRGTSGQTDRVNC